MLVAFFRAQQYNEITKNEQYMNSIGSERWPECFYRTPKKLRLLVFWIAVAFSDERTAVFLFSGGYDYEINGRKNPDRRYCAPG